MTCQQSGCREPATCVVFWPGQTTRQCEPHARALAALSSHMGFQLEIGLLIPLLSVPLPAVSADGVPRLACGHYLDHKGESPICWLCQQAERRRRADKIP